MKPKFYRKVLKNGFTVILEKRSLPVVAVGVAVRAGGMNETLSEKGISHFIEHMLYKGTPSRNTKKIAEEIERNGGILNGFTDESVTAYHCKMPSKHLDVALKVLADMVQNPLFDGKELEKERKVIFEEMKMRRDRPDVYVLDEIQSFLYQGTLGLSLIGSEKTMNSITREKMIKKFKKIYTPNNMVLCVVGDADFDGLVKFAEKNFGNEKGKVPSFEVEGKNENKIEKRKGLEQANLVFAYHIPLFKDKKSYAARMLITLMAIGMSSRLFLEIREKRNLAYSIKGHSTIEKDFAHSFIYVGTTKENVNQVKDIILKEFEKVFKNLDGVELGQVKDQMIGNHQISMEDSEVEMMSLLSCEINGNARAFYEFEKDIRDVKLKDVKELAKKVLKSHSVFALVPE